MAALKELASQVTDLTGQELAELGFKQRGDGIFTRELGADALGWIGLNQATEGRPGVLEINPVVGIRDQRVERVLAELRQEKPRRYVPPTLSVHLGYLMPEQSYKPCFFQEAAPPLMPVKEMVDGIRAYGLPFMENNATLEALVTTIERSGFGIPEQNHYRLPVMYYLLGRAAFAEEYLVKRLRDLGDRKDAAAEYYRRFATSLRGRLGN